MRLWQRGICPLVANTVGACQGCLQFECRVHDILFAYESEFILSCTEHLDLSGKQRVRGSYVLGRSPWLCRAIPLSHRASINSHVQLSVVNHLSLFTYNSSLNVRLDDFFPANHLSKANITNSTSLLWCISSAIFRNGSLMQTTFVIDFTSSSRISHIKMYLSLYSFF